MKDLKDYQHNLGVSEDELKTGVREQLRQQFAYYGMQQADDEMMVGALIQYKMSMLLFSKYSY